MSKTNNNLNIDFYKENKENKENNINIFSNYEEDNLKNKLYYLEKKYELKESECVTKIQSLTNQLLLMKDTHIQLKNQLLLKDKAISEFNTLIKDYQMELLNYKQKIELKNQKIRTLKDKLNSIKLNNNLISNVLNSNRTIEYDLNRALSDKGKAEIEIKELKDIINKNNCEINKIKEKNFDIQKKIIDLEKEKNELSIENKKLLLENENFKKVIDEKNINLNKHENTINELNEKNNEFQNIFNKYNIQMRDNNQQINNLMGIDNIMRDTINELKTLKNKIEKEKNEAIINMNTIIKESNDNINVICDWIENYMSEPIENKVAPDISLSLSNGFTKEKKEKVSFKKLINLLQDTRNKMIDSKKIELTNENNNKDDKGENNDKDKVNQILIEIKSIYNNLKDEIKNKNYFDYSEENKQTNNDNKDEVNIINNLNNIINELLKYLTSIKNNNENLKENNNNAKLQNNNNEKEDNKIKDGSNNDEEIKKLNQLNKIYEKKIKNLETNIELKQMEINSLQEIIERRTNINFSDNGHNFNEYMKLKKDKEKLLKDNMKLINQNKKLEDLLNSEKNNNSYLTQ